MAIGYFRIHSVVSIYIKLHEMHWMSFKNSLPYLSIAYLWPTSYTI